MTYGSDRAFIGVSALLFVGSATLTIAWCASMSAMGGMPMPGGWSMSMGCLRLPGQTWRGAAASFVGMWAAMMAAMMLPSLVPTLCRHRRAIARATVSAGTTASRSAPPQGQREVRLGWLTALVGLGYFFVWTILGMAAFPLGAALAAIAMRHPALARAVPSAVGAVVLIAGLIQFTAWKAHHLACCRAAPGPGRALPPDFGTAWRLGCRHGLHCSQSCAGPMAILLVTGIMDLRAMAVVTVAMTLERFAPDGERVAWALGAIAVGAGLLLIAQAAGPA